MSALILAIDPGGTTGFAWGYIEDHKLTVAPAEERVEGWELFTVLELVCRGHKHKEWHIIWETFEYRYHSRPGLDPTPIKLIGIIELFQSWHDTETKFWPQTASQGLGSVPDQKLKDLGLWFKGKGHGRAATKHLLRWCSFGYGAKLMKGAPAQYEMISVDEFAARYNV